MYVCISISLSLSLYIYIYTHMGYLGSVARRDARRKRVPRDRLAVRGLDPRL